MTNTIINPKINIKMKKFLSMMAIAALLLTFAACGDDDEPAAPVIPSELESVYTDITQTHYSFEIDMDEDSCGVDFYNVRFSIGATQSPPFKHIKIEAPLSRQGNVYTYQGTNIVPKLYMSGVGVPMSEFIVTNYKVVVDLDRMTYSIYFECHGGSYSDSGSVRLPQSQD